MVITNPVYYVFDRVSASGWKSRGERTVVQLGIRAQKVWMLEQSGYAPQVAKAALRVEGKWRSGKVKNKRQPLRKKRRGAENESKGEGENTVLNMMEVMSEEGSDHLAYQSIEGEDLDMDVDMEK